jgi:hypothetical protein
MQCKTYATECKRNCTDKCACENSYHPSNGTEGMSFIEDFCLQCIHDNPYLDTNEHHWMGKRRCDIFTATLCFHPPDPEYPKEWIYLAGKPTCTKFVKWDWGNDGDPDDPENPKAPPPPPDPNQLHLFPLYPDERAFIITPERITVRT